MPDPALRSRSSRTLPPKPAEGKAPPKRRRKALRISLIAAAALLVALPVLAYLLLGPILRVKVVGFLERTTHAPVRLRSAGLRLAGGAQLRSLSILNPPGYAEPEAFHLEDLKAATSVTALLQNPLAIRELTIVQPEFTLEFGERESNWAHLIRTASRELSEKKSPPDPDPQKFIIRNIRIVKPMIRIAPMKLVPNGALVRLNDVTLDYIGNTPDSPSTFSLAVAAIFQALFTGDRLESGRFPSALSSRLADEFREAGRAFSEAVTPSK